MEVSGVPDLDLKTFTAVVIFSDLAETGTFESSHAMINQLHSNIIWGMRGNFISIPTDCPQRDERLGWTGDIQVFAPTANYLYDASAFLSSWLKDVRADQKKFNGIVPTVVPFVHMHGNKPVPHAIWADVIILLPWDLYTSFGDVKVLEDNFSSMISWLEDGLPRGPNRLWDKLAPNYADWLDPRAPPQYPAHGITDTHLVANAYLTHVTGVVSRVASILGHDDLATKYSAEHDRFISLFREEYITSTGRLTSDSQTAYTLALRFGLFEDRLIPRAVERLSYLIRWNYFKISTGFAGTPIILSVLADNNLLGLAYRMLQEKDCPSWLYTVSMGATTMVSAILQCALTSVGKVGQHASGRNNQSGENDFIQSLRSWLGSRILTQRRWRFITPRAWLEIGLDQTPARRYSIVCYNVLCLTVRFVQGTMVIVGRRLDREYSSPS